MLGLIALTNADRVAEGTNGIFLAIEDFPAGTVILWIMVVGLTAYALFRLASPVFDIENSGSDAKGWGKRLGHAGSAIGHFALAFSAYQFATSDGNDAEGGNGAQEAAAGVLSVEFGGVVLGMLGIAFFLAAIFQAKRGYWVSSCNVSASEPPTRHAGSAGSVSSRAQSSSRYRLVAVPGRLHFG